MSTCYALLKSPVTHIAVEPQDDGEWSRVTLSVNHQLVGVLVVPQAEVRDFVQLFFNDSDSVVTNAEGIYSQADTRNWRDDVILLSEYGKLATWGAIKRGD